MTEFIQKQRPFFEELDTHIDKNDIITSSDFERFSNELTKRQLKFNYLKNTV